MLIIRKEQIQYFIAETDAELIELIARAIRVGNGERVLEYSDETVERMVKIGIARARAHDFERAEDIAAFVAVMFEIAPNFDENAEVKAILDDTNFSVEERFKQLWGRTSDKLWVELENEYDARIWFPGADNQQI
ncbi:MAG TPA: hypothetical protein VGC76_19105 [Pyrinomonadaceae bacterium]|jgi:hypothetical protein